MNLSDTCRAICLDFDTREILDFDDEEITLEPFGEVDDLPGVAEFQIEERDWRCDSTCYPGAEYTRWEKTMKLIAVLSSTGEDHAVYRWREAEKMVGHHQKTELDDRVFDALLEEPMGEGRLYALLKRHGSLQEIRYAILRLRKSEHIRSNARRPMRYEVAP